MACKVNWQRFMTRQRLLQRRLATKCGCASCKKRLKIMDDTDRVMRVNEDNRSQKLYETVNESEKI